MNRWKNLEEIINEGDFFSAVTEEKASGKEITQGNFLKLAENAVGKGKYLFAAKAYERAYGEKWKDIFLDKYIKEGIELLSSNNINESIKKFITAASLAEPLRPNQSKGMDIHRFCTEESCFLQESDINKVADSVFQLMLNHEKILEVLRKQSIDLKKSILKTLVKEQNPGLESFLERFSDAINIIKEGTSEYINQVRKLDVEDDVISNYEEILKAIRGQSFETLKSFLRTLIKEEFPELLDDVEKLLSQSDFKIPQYKFFLEEVKELQNIQYDAINKLEAIKLKEKLDFLIGKLRGLSKLDLIGELNTMLSAKNINLLNIGELDIIQELNSILDGKDNHFKPFGDFKKYGVQSEYEDSLREKAQEYRKAVYQSLEGLILDILDMSKDFTDRVSGSLYDRLIEFLNQFTQMKKDSITKENANHEEQSINMELSGIKEKMNSLVEKLDVTIGGKKDSLADPIVYDNIENLIIDIFNLSGSYINKISDYLFEMLIHFLQQIIKMKKNLMLNYLMETYIFSQRILLGIKTDTDSNWQYVKELSTSYPISVFLVCIRPNAFLKYYSSKSDDILRELRGLIKMYRIIVPIIRPDGKNMAEFMEIAN